MSNYDEKRSRKHKATIWLDDEEFALLSDWSDACQISKSEYVRSLIKGIRPAEFPPAEYENILSELRKVGININQLASKAHSLGFIDEREYRKDAERLWNVVAELSRQMTRSGVKFGSNEDMGC